MKCPECVKLGTPSRLNEHDASPARTCAHQVERFYDEQGDRHIHDHLPTRTVFACTNGHAYDRLVLSRCPCRGCAWNEDERVKAGDRWNFPNHVGIQVA